MSKAFRAAFACAVCMSLGLAPLFMGTLPLFLQPVSKEFEWGTAIYPQAALVAGIAGALLGPIIGQLIDRLGVRPVMVVGLLGWAGSLAGLSWLNGSQIQLLSISVLMGIFAAACGPIAFAKIVAGWFDRNRGLALGIVLSAAPAVATALMIVVANTLLAAYGWRLSYRIFAVAVVCLAVPVTFFFMHEAQIADSTDKSDVQHAGGYTALQALRSREFWKVMLLTGLVCGVVQSLVVHFVGFSAEYGVSATSATVALSIFSLVGPVGPLLAGALADRVRGPKALVVFYSVPLLGLLTLILWGSAAATPAMLLFGVGFQAASGMLPYLLTRYFGVRYASQIFGVGLGIVTLSMGFGPVILGFARDRLQSFTPTTPILIGLLLGAIAVSVSLRKYEATQEGPLDDPSRHPVSRQDRAHSTDART